MRKGTVLFIIISAIIIVFTSNSHAVHTGWFAPEYTKALKNPFVSQKGAAVVGKKIYDDACAKCHGDKGKADGYSAGSLQIELPDFSNKEVTIEETDGEWFWKVRTGQFEMPPFQMVLKDDEIWKVVIYLRTLAK